MNQNKSLKEINEELIDSNSSFPEVKLKSGKTVQTGTVAGLIQSIRDYDRSPSLEIEERIRLAVPTLFQIGLFEIFQPAEWISPKSPGRTCVGKEAFEYLRKEEKE